MELKFSVCWVIALFVCLLVVELTSAKSVTIEANAGETKSVQEDNEPQRMDFMVHILNKRDTSQQEEEIDGQAMVRTFPASEPLDPNSPQSNGPAELFGDFEPVNEIFQPTIVDETEQTEHSDEKTEDEDTKVSDEDTAKEEAEDTEKGTKALTGQYSAQYPYSSVSRTSGQGHGSSSSQGGQDPTYVQRRVVLTGGHGQPTTETQHTQTVYSDGSQAYNTQHVGQVGNPYPSGSSSYNRQYTSGTYHSTGTGSGTGGNTGSQYTGYQTPGSSYSGSSGYPTSGSSNTGSSRYTGSSHGGSSGYPNSGSSYTGSSGYTGSSYGGSSGYPTSGSSNTGHSGYTGSSYGGSSGYQTSGSSNTGSSGYPTSGSSNRGAYYSGQRYVDNNGHYIDAQGRHLDSTGRYYDTSGRYQDATITRTVTYQSGTNPGQSYVDSSGQSYGYTDQSRNYPSQYSGSSTQTGSTYGTSYGSGSGGQQGSTLLGGTPVNSYGGTQFYSGGQGYPATYDPIVSRISSATTCSSRTNIQVTINGLTCTNAVSQIGAFVCYNYERVSNECCERCLQVKQAGNVGCEYGDRSNQCRNIQPYDCYNQHNSQICCQTCQTFRNQRSHLVSPCEYGDKTPRCQDMIQRSHLCYLPQNQRLCCETCPRLENTQEPDCKWGNQNPDLCVPFDSANRLRLNCYMSAVQEVCCATCRSLRERIRDPVAGCEYGDQPVQITTNQGVLDCREYIRQYGMENCNGGEIAQKCCYTCHRYRQRG